MPQIDVILHFASLAAALADPVVQQHVTTDPQTQQVSVMHLAPHPTIECPVATDDNAMTSSQLQAFGSR